jgi:hypothetical protein
MSVVLLPDQDTVSVKELCLDLSRAFDDDEVMLEHSDFEFRLADSRGRRSSSSLLINRMYSWRGYKSVQGDPLQIDAITLQACRGEQVFGTLSLCFDSPRGLPADSQYRLEVDRYRTAGARLCELTRFAVDPEFGSKHVLGALFHLAYIHGALLHGATDVLIEVNPRHVSFYQRMLHFRQIGQCRICERVNAVAVLLHLEVAYVADQLARHGSRRERDRSSLYPYFFSRDEARALPHRLSVEAPRAVG